MATDRGHSYDYKCFKDIEIFIYDVLDLVHVHGISIEIIFKKILIPRKSTGEYSRFVVHMTPWTLVYSYKRFGVAYSFRRQGSDGSQKRLPWSLGSKLPRNIATFYKKSILLHLPEGVNIVSVLNTTIVKIKVTSCSLHISRPNVEHGLIIGQTIIRHFTTAKVWF
jgi:hypothetical protein